jgi:glycosyltransferase involved in cell wall biosynthesis
MDAPVASLTAEVALASRRDTGAIDGASRQDADVLLEVGGDLPFEDAAVRELCLGDAAAALGARDALQLLIECRRVLAPAARLRLVEPDAHATHVALGRLAALAGLRPLADDAGGPGWHSAPHDGDDDPLVSIVIPSSNPRYFPECIDSAIAQTWRNVEIVVSDDCRSEAIAELVRARQSVAPIRYVKNPVRLGARGNFEQCMALARGTYVKFLNDDDVLEPDCVATLVDAFVRIPGLTLATSNRLRIDGASRPLPDMPATRPAVERDLVIDGVSLANAAVMYGLNFIGEPSTALLRKRDFEPRPGMDTGSPFNFNGEEVRGAVDFAMWTRVLVQGKAAFFARRLSHFRIHEEQAQARQDVVDRSIAGIRGLQRQWIELGLFRRWPPHLLWARDYDGDPDEWRLEPVRAFPHAAVPPDEALAAWRSTRRHPFDTAAIA